MHTTTDNSITLKAAKAYFQISSLDGRSDSQRNKFETETEEERRRRIDEEHGALSGANVPRLGQRAHSTSLDAERLTQTLAEKLKEIAGTLNTANDTVRMVRDISAAENQHELKSDFERRQKILRDEHKEFYNAYEHFDGAAEGIKGLSDATGSAKSLKSPELSIASVKERVGSLRGSIFFTANFLIGAAEALELELLRLSSVDTNAALVNARLPDLYRTALDDIRHSLKSLHRADSELNVLQHFGAPKQKESVETDSYALSA